MTCGMAGVEEGAPLDGEGGLIGLRRDVDVVAPANVPNEEEGDREDDDDNGYADACGNSTVGSHLVALPQRPWGHVGMWHSQWLAKVGVNDGGEENVTGWYRGGWLPGIQCRTELLARVGLGRYLVSTCLAGRSGGERVVRIDSEQLEHRENGGRVARGKGTTDGGRVR